MGHPTGRYHIETWGCQMNVHDSEKLAGLLEREGYIRADDEHDADFVRTVWQRAASGSSSAELEVELPADSYRIRRLFEHWVSEGSLVQRPEAKEPKSPEPPPSQPSG